jgi:DNA replication initiation complex subunit (GINS family)
MQRSVLRRCFRRNSQQDSQDDESTDQKAQKGVNLMQNEIEPGRFEAGDMIRVRAPDPTCAPDLDDNQADNCLMQCLLPC